MQKIRSITYTPFKLEIYLQASKPYLLYYYYLAVKQIHKHTRTHQTHMRVHKHAHVTHLSCKTNTQAHTQNIHAHVTHLPWGSNRATGTPGQRRRRSSCNCWRQGIRPNQKCRTSAEYVFVRVSMCAYVHMCVFILCVFIVCECVCMEEEPRSLVSLQSAGRIGTHAMFLLTVGRSSHCSFARPFKVARFYLTQQCTLTGTLLLSHTCNTKFRFLSKLASITESTPSRSTYLCKSTGMKYNGWVGVIQFLCVRECLFESV